MKRFTRKPWIRAGLVTVLIALTVGGIVVAMQPSTEGDGAAPRPDAELEVSPDTGEYSPADAGEETGERQELALLGDVTPEMVERAVELGHAWVNYQTGTPFAEREAALAAAITNPGDWVSAIPTAANPPESFGRAGWKSDVTVTGVRAPAVEQMTVNGVGKMVVEVEFQALYSSGPGIYEGSASSTQTWIFLISPDGELLDVWEPDIAW